MRQRNAEAARGPSILDSAWLSYRPKGLLLHGEAASDDVPLARATNAASVIYLREDNGGEKRIAVSGQIPCFVAESFACDAFAQ
jgi:hypothetical protein